MATLKDKPAPTDVLSVSQGDIQGNVEYFQGAMGKDHQVVFGNTAPGGTVFEGRHTQVAFNNRSGTPPTVASVADGADSVLYSANGNLFLSSSINNGPFKLTNVQNNTALYGLNTNNYNGVGANFTGGYVFLGPLIYQYGTFIQPAGISPSSGTVIFPIPFTSIPSINVLITPICKAGGSSVAHTVSLITGTITTTQFQWSYDTTTTAQVGLTWIATGI